MKKIMLLNPPYSNYYDTEHYKISRPKNTSSCILPIGIAYIASFLVKHGATVDFINLELNPLSFPELAEKVNKNGIEIIGITAVSSLISYAIKLASYLKKNTKAFIVLGGVHANAEPIETLSVNCFDALALGEGELIALDLVNDIPIEDIKGLIYIKNGKLKINPKRPLISDLDKIPFPLTGLSNTNINKPSLHREIDPSINNNNYYTMISSRGCPYECKFCYSKAISNKVRTRSIKNVVDEIELYHKKHSKVKIMFYDDTFTLTPKRISDFCSLIKSKNIDIVWGCNTRVDAISPKLLKTMKNSGCKRIYIGVESGNDKILSDMTKGLTKDKIRKKVALIKESGIEVSASYIVGAPGETRKTIENTIKFSIELNTEYAHFYLYTIDPGSPYYVEFKKKGIIKPFEWLDYHQMIKQGVNFLGEDMEWNDLIHYTKKAYNMYYTRDEYRFMMKAKAKNNLELKQIEKLINNYDDVY